VQLLKNFPAFYGPRRFVTVFTRALHWSLSWARSIQFIPSHPIYLRSILTLFTHLRYGLPSGLFPSCFPTSILYAFLFSPFVLHALPMFLACFPYFEKNNSRFIKSHAVCVSVNPSLSTFECLNQSLWNFVCIHGIWAHLNGIFHKFFASVSVYVTLIVARQRLGKKSYRGNEYTRINRKIVGRVVLYAVLVVSQESRWQFFPELLAILFDMLLLGRQHH
jgi:hypothetical protein